MPRIMRLASLVLFSGLSLFLVWFGWVYATVPVILSFHAAALPESARGDMWPLYDALMNLIGGSSIALGLLGLALVAGPVRRGQRWAALALTGAHTIAFGMAAITAEGLARTGAPTSWHIMGVLIAINAVALGAHAASQNVRAPGP